MAASLTILIPNFNDWESLSLLLPKIDQAVRGSGHLVGVFVVDDASTDPMPENWPGISFSTLNSVEVLRLRSNQGHQRAIALGLYHLHEFTNAEAVVIMDGDGEDRPEDLPALLRAFSAAGGTEVIFAARTRRIESLAFRLCYQAYRAIHYVLTGVIVQVGNFSVLPRSAMTQLMTMRCLPKHYAASVYRAGLPRKLVRLARGRRLAGHSKMNFVSLLKHGLTAISVLRNMGRSEDFILDAPPFILSKNAVYSKRTSTAAK